VNIKTNHVNAETLEAELLADVAAGVAEIDAGAGLSNSDAKAELRKRFER